MSSVTFHAIKGIWTLFDCQALLFKGKEACFACILTTNVRVYLHSLRVLTKIKCCITKASFKG
jgi:hypothetical protein